MKTGKTIRGATHLAFDAVEQVTTIAEGMYRNIAATPFPLGPDLTGRAPGIAGFVHEAIRQVNGLTREVSDLALEPLTPYLDELAEPGPQREAVVALLNGICGDHLERTNNTLALPLGFRVVTAGGRRCEVSRAIEEGLLDPTRKILVLVHGLCMNDAHFDWNGHDHGQMLAHELGYTPVYVRYNSGRHISQNGRELAFALERLLASWPVEVEAISLLGYSMGGLVTRAATKIGEAADLRWLRLVDRAVYVATPHHGAMLERGGAWLQAVAGFSPYTAPLSALGRLRSDGITDLRFGNVLDADWQSHDPHQDRADHRVAAPLTKGIDHYAIAATMAGSEREARRDIRGDGLVLPDSALGRHQSPPRSLGFDETRTRVFYGRGHLKLLEDPEVAACLREFLG